MDSTLQVAFKAIGKHPIQAIDTKMILDFLMPIWRKTPETCTRIRGRCEAIFNYAISLNRFDGLIRHGVRFSRLTLPAGSAAITRREL